jgi:hypothetical protein
MNKLSTMLFQIVTVEQCCNSMLTILFIVGRTTLFTPVDINLEQVVDFLNFYACSTEETTQTHFLAGLKKLFTLLGLKTTYLKDIQPKRLVNVICKTGRPKYDTILSMADWTNTKTFNNFKFIINHLFLFHLGQQYCPPSNKVIFSVQIVCYSF